MNLRKLLLIIVLLALVLAPRIAGLKSFVTIDEPFWLSVGANFYYALGQRELQNTVYEYHPAVTTMWFVTDAFLAYFPQYRALDQGYFDVDKEKFDPFIVEHGKSPLELLYFSRLFQLAVIAAMALVIFYLFSLLFDDEKAFLATALMACAPFFLGHSRVLDHEAMLAFFVIASFLGLMLYLEYGRKWPYLLISAAAAALAQLTKSSAMAMLPAIALMLAVSVFEHGRERGFGRALLDHLKIFGIWFAMLAVVYVIIWPGMWVAPGRMLYEVYGNAFSYAFQGARLQVTEELQLSNFSLAAAGGTIQNYVGDLLWRSTPVTWLGVIFAIVALFQRNARAHTAIFRKLTLYLFVNVVMFVLLFSLAQGRNSPHYIMASHVSLEGIAALGWVMGLGWLSQRWETSGRLGVRPERSRRVRWGIGLGLVAFQLASALSFYPYYYTYYNPLMAGLTGSLRPYDYGEGFEQAAAYLAAKPDAESLKVFSFRGRGPFSYFFPGQTIILNPLFIEEPGMASMVERLTQSDYLVFNDALAGRTERSALFVNALNGVEPEHTIPIHGIYDIHIYRVADLPTSFYETISK
ncbi:MAG: glycosyltransferase family 39 protein [Chloroflexi bacterium]|nr:glycosyltransferase family 39 protein [Chloroflexota bacterium]